MNFTKIENPTYLYLKFKEFNSETKTFLIDFDYTLADFGKAKYEILTMLQNFGMTREIWDKNYTLAKNDVHVFKLDKMLELLASELGTSVSELEPTFNLVWENYYRYLYQDVISFLEKHQNLNLIIFSLGAEEFQIKKLLGTKLDKYLTGAIYTKVPKGEVVKDIFKDFKLEKFSLIDDRALNLDEIYKNSSGTNIDYYWLRRSKGKYRDEILNMQEAKIVESLLQI